MNEYFKPASIGDYTLEQETFPVYMEKDYREYLSNLQYFKLDNTRDYQAQLLDALSFSSHKASIISDTDNILSAGFAASEFPINEGYIVLKQFFYEISGCDAHGDLTITCNLQLRETVYLK